MSTIRAFISWCWNCKAMTGTKKEKQGKGQVAQYYCKVCGQTK